MKRRGNRRYYQHHDVLLIRRIRELLYEQGFTISGARNRLRAMAARSQGERTRPVGAAEAAGRVGGDEATSSTDASPTVVETDAESPIAPLVTLSAAQVRQELLSIRGLHGLREVRQTPIIASNGA